jgi:anaerobic selenocysteine-containing dehydrogenase
MSSTIKAGNKKVVYTTCKSCHGGCGVKVTVVDGVPVHIEGNPDSLTRAPCAPRGCPAFSTSTTPIGSSTR